MEDKFTPHFKKAPKALPHMQWSESIRSWQLLCLGLFALCLLQSIIFVFLFPLKETEIRYVELLSDGNVYFKELPTDDLSSDRRQLFIRKAIRRFVKLYNTKDNIPPRKIGEEIQELSTQSVFNKFNKEYTEMYNNASDNRREALIKKDYDAGTDKKGNPIRRVEFTVNEIDDENRLVNTGHFLATITYTYDPTYRPSKQHELYNPLGLKVTDFQVNASTQ